MRAAHRLSALQVRIRRQHGIGERFGLHQQRLLQLGDGGIHAMAGIHRPQARGRRDLVVARAAGVQLGGDGAGFLVQEPVDHRVNIFVGCHRRRAVGDAQRHAIEPLLQRIALVTREHARVAERPRPRLGQAHVMRPESEVGADRAIDRIEERRWAAGESTTPQLMGSGFGRAHRKLRTGFEGRTTWEI